MFKSLIAKFILFFLSVMTLSVHVKAQEFNATVSVLTQQLTNNANKPMFVTLQKQLNNFINNRQWTSDKYLPQERINCSFIFNIKSADESGNCTATLTVQAARRIYHSDYQSPLLNYQDANIEFKYVQYQNVNFNKNNPFGTEPMTGNLTAIIAFYIDYILGMTYDSYALNGGASFYKEANTILTSVPSGQGLTGWTSFDGSRNRYWMVENRMNPRMSAFSNIIYEYFRNGLDQLYDAPATAQKNIAKTLEQLQVINKINPNTMFVQQFMFGRSTELIGIFQKAAPDIKADIKENLLALDPANAEKYENALK